MQARAPVRRLFLRDIRQPIVDEVDGLAAPSPRPTHSLSVLSRGEGSRQHSLRIGTEIGSPPQHCIGFSEANSLEAESAEAFTNIDGMGARATVANEGLLVGNRRLMDAERVDVAEVEANAKRRPRGARPPSRVRRLTPGSLRPVRNPAHPGRALDRARGGRRPAPAARHRIREHSGVRS